METRGGLNEEKLLRVSRNRNQSIGGCLLCSGKSSFSGKTKETR